MQEALEPAAAALGRRPAQQFAGVDLRRPKGYAAPPSPPAAAAPASQEAAPAEGDPCPRCESRDTKFCYYNNYNTSQPRHFCKGCRRYWTKGGTLRNVPVGGGTRKKPSSSSSSPLSSYAAAAKPKRPYKKKRRVAPPEPAAVASPAADAAKPTTAETTATATTTTATTPTTDAASGTTAELLVPATEDDSFAHLLHADDAVALGLGLSDLPSGKGAALLEPDSFEWPASLDLGAYWSGAGFADSDPAIFLNLP